MFFNFLFFVLFIWIVQNHAKDNDDLSVDLSTRSIEPTSTNPTIEEKRKLAFMRFINALTELLGWRREHRQLKPFSKLPEKQSMLILRPSSSETLRSPETKSSTQILPLLSTQSIDLTTIELNIEPLESTSISPEEESENKNEVEYLPVHNAIIGTGKIFSYLPNTIPQPYLYRSNQNLDAPNIYPPPYYIMYQSNEDKQNVENYPYYYGVPTNPNANKNFLEIAMENLNNGLQQIGSEWKKSIENLFCCANNHF